MIGSVGVRKEREREGVRGGNEPMRGWTMNPDRGPASHTSEVACLLSPRERRYGVPNLFIPHHHSISVVSLSESKEQLRLTPSQ